nr:RecName: Full=Glucoamylase; AltName: Full=1,4-alpha-D-glucan glucohydrolase; AltName: Full=Glucan 1,4-alpha-glucosidase [Bacillus licheniformis]
SSNKLTTSWG